ncbi:hypothetical protein GCWU000324_02574 [Kingella oralis ATCC 51147]|uniref:Uncharacterized protein n=1 Tax=Kingella oralis ATCC 51147 TaxID=629741 RepID=C4GLK2_9NEIS|nr:hypothetical protein GCWU000324_02574 [Kingella oralis ATCC 51147]
MMVLLCFGLDGRGILAEKGRLKTGFGGSDGSGQLGNLDL